MPDLYLRRAGNVSSTLRTFQQKRQPITVNKPKDSKCEKNLLFSTWCAHLPLTAGDHEVSVT